MNYFGTGLNGAGHYFWILHNESKEYKGLDFKSVPFNPEDFPRNYGDYREKGHTEFYKEADYSILAIEGACSDNRWGSKSVFWLKEDLTKEEMKERILAIPIAVKILKQMPFEVKW